MTEYKALILEGDPAEAGQLERLLAEEGLERDKDYLLAGSLDELRGYMARHPRIGAYFLDDQVPAVAGRSAKPRFHESYRIIDGANRDHVFYTGSVPDRDTSVFLRHSHVDRVEKREIPGRITEGYRRIPSPPDAL